MINVAVLGYGVVGSGTVEVIMDNAEEISKKVKEGLTACSWKQEQGACQRSIACWKSNI